MINFLLLILASMLAGYGLTYAARYMLLKRAQMDIPNERSMHKIPVPRGGGVAILIVSIIGISFALLRQGNFLPQGWMLIATALLAAVSWLDDQKSVSIGLRFSTHILAALFGSLALGQGVTLFGDALPFWLDRTLMVVGWAWFMNLYNFMDGIDGITGSQSICIAIGVCLIALLAGTGGGFIFILSAVLIGVCVGFLILNWHPAKIFMGDVGSIPLGFLLGYLLLTLAISDHLVAALILPLYYLADSGITIAKRLLRREKIWQAHRQHFYQKATLKILNHAHVVRVIIAGNLGLIGCAVGSLYQPIYGLFAAIVIVAILLYWMDKKSKLDS